MKNPIKEKKICYMTKINTRIIKSSTIKRGINSLAVIPRSSPSQSEVQGNTRLLSEQQNHSSWQSRNASSDSMNMEEINTGVNNLTANTNNNTNSNANSIIMSVKSKKRSFSSDSGDDYSNKKVLTSKDNENIKENKQSQGIEESQGNEQAQHNEQSQGTEQLQYNEQSMENVSELNKEYIQSWINEMSVIAKAPKKCRIPEDYGQEPAAAGILKNDPEYIQHLAEVLGKIIKKSKITLDEIESLVQLIEISAQKDIVIRLTEIKSTEFSQGEYGSSFESDSEQSDNDSDSLSTLSDDSNLSDESESLQEGDTTSPSPVQGGDTTSFSPSQQGGDTTTSSSSQQVGDTISSSSQQLGNTILPSQQVDNSNVPPIDPDWADNPELTVYHRPASDDGVLSVNNSTDVSDPLAGEGLAPLNLDIAPNMVTYSGLHREDEFSHCNYLVKLSGADNMDYRLVYEYIIDAINYLDILLIQYRIVDHLEYFLFENDPDNAQVATSMLYTGAKAAFEILSAIN